MIIAREFPLIESFHKQLSSYKGNPKYHKCFNLFCFISWKILIGAILVVRVSSLLVMKFKERAFSSTENVSVGIVHNWQLILVFTDQNHSKIGEVMLCVLAGRTSARTDRLLGV